MTEEHELRNKRGGGSTTVRSWQQPRIIYLTTYNVVFASLWASVILNASSHAFDSKTKLFAATEPQARWIQTVSLVEVLNAALGKCLPVHFTQVLIDFGNRPHQIAGQYHSNTSCQTRHPSVDDMVQLSRQHRIIKCLSCITAGLVRR